MHKIKQFMFFSPHCWTSISESRPHNPVPGLIFCVVSESQVTHSKFWNQTNNNNQGNINLENISITPIHRVSWIRPAEALPHTSSRACARKIHLICWFVLFVCAIVFVEAGRMVICPVSCKRYCRLPGLLKGVYR